MKCPRCQKTLDSQPEAGDLVVCSGCGARLRAKKPPSRAPQPTAVETPGTPATHEPPAASREPGPGTGGEAAPDVAPPPPAAGEDRPAWVSSLVEEMNALRYLQQEALSLLRDLVGTRAGLPARDEEALRGEPDGELPFPPDRPEREPAFASVPRPPVRSGTRKSVLLIDDDEATASAACSALETAQIPFRRARDANGGLALMAEQRPDVIALELGLEGDLSGRDAVNLIKATMEWVDIPIILFTREPVENQKEARQIHGADELVRKVPGSEKELVNRVVAFFRR
jgi:CheY-like chemotaxis protein/DNA-directed RNA polymerase subunit RPC12/RpoP